MLCFTARMAPAGFAFDASSAVVGCSVGGGESASALRLWLRPSFDRAAAAGIPPLTLLPAAARGDSLRLYLFIAIAIGESIQLTFNDGAR